MAMKRIEAFIASEKTPYVLSVLETLGLQATFYESKGMGKGLCCIIVLVLRRTKA